MARHTKYLLAPGSLLDSIDLGDSIVTAIEEDVESLYAIVLIRA
jgi:hypothetical protein